MDNTIIQQGRFVAQGTNAAPRNIQLPLRNGIDWIEVINITQSADVTNGAGVEFYWQLGMAQNDGVVKYHPAADHTLAIDTAVNAGVGGFTLFDSSLQQPGAATAYTAVSNANPPVVSSVVVAGTLNNGDIVRLYNGVGCQQLGSIDFTVDTVTIGASFRLPYMAQIVAAAAPGANAVWRRIPYDPIFYPRRRFISAITQAAQAVVKMTVTHGYQLGQMVRMVVPAGYGMVEMNGLQGTIVALSTANNTITLDIDSTGFTAFAFPLTAAVPFSPAEVVPLGENTAEANILLVDPLTDAIVNQSSVGIILAGGIKSPGGSVSVGGVQDVMYWRAGTSFSSNIQPI
jgi:hypothetical protein